MVTQKVKIYEDSVAGRRKTVSRHNAVASSYSKDNQRASHRSCTDLKL